MIEFNRATALNTNIKMEGAQPDQQLQFLQEELIALDSTSKSSKKWNEQISIPSIWINQVHTADPFSDPNKHRFNHYADKQLCHLVIEEEFNFEKIATTMNYVFREERNRYTERSCRQRWTQLHTLRQKGDMVKQKRMEDKRASSVSTFSDPYSLYNLQEMLEKIQSGEATTPSTLPLKPPEYKGYNILKNSIRQIDDMPAYKKREGEMLRALQLAKEKTVTDKLMHFEPYYERLNEFEVKQQELTEEKMKEIMSRPIEMERLEKELRVKDMNELEEEWKNKRSPKKQTAEGKKDHEYDIQDNWDQYESD